MITLCTYVMKHDAGLAPNPFWNICTLAVCTPNHQGSRVRAGDWIAGVSDKSTGYKLIYAMQVDERIHMNDYFGDPRFQCKKPRSSGTANERCGDNFYSLGADGGWLQHPNEYHNGPQYLARDTRHPFVFIGRRYWYLGRDAVSMPANFAPLFGGRGARVSHPPELVQAFCSWVESTLKEGLNALPRDLVGHAKREACVAPGSGTAQKRGRPGAEC